MTEVLRRVHVGETRLNTSALVRLWTDNMHSLTPAYIALQPLPVSLNPPQLYLFFFFLNDPAPPEISPLPLPAALPTPAIRQERPHTQPHLPIRAIANHHRLAALRQVHLLFDGRAAGGPLPGGAGVVRETIERSEEHTSELQSPCNLVCRLLLEKKKNKR